MTDLPSQGMFQKLSAHSVSGEHLEVLGKRAAALFLDGSSTNLSDAVIGVVKEAGLSTEQVLRVIEFANTDAFLSEFKKESGAGHRIVNFSGGPADPSVVLKELNTGGTPETFDRGDADYNQPPAEALKTASDNARTEREFWEKLGSAEPTDLPEENPLGDVVRLRDELLGKHAQATSVISELECRFEDLSNVLFGQVKQACLAGVPLADICQAWETVAPDFEYVKLAFLQLQQPLVENGVFRSDLEFATSFEKRANEHRVNKQHPLVTNFADYCEALNKLASIREAQETLAEGVAQLTHFLKEADNKGLLVKGFDKAKSLARQGGAHAQVATEKLLAGSGAEKYAPAVNTAVSHLPEAALAVAGLEAGKQVMYNPTSQRIQHLIWRNNPASSSWDQHTQGIQMGIGDPYGQNYGGYL